MEKIADCENLDIYFSFLIRRYAYAVASALHGVGNILHKDFMIQVCNIQQSRTYVLLFEG